MTAVCAGTKRDGTPCTANSIPGERWCYHHPEYAEERKQSASRAASAKHSSVGREMREVRELILELLELAVADRWPLRVRKDLQNIVQLLQCYLRAAELEMRAAEEPLRTDLDAKGLRAEVLRRVGELEEREREELFAGVAMAGEHGLDAGALGAVMGG